MIYKSLHTEAFVILAAMEFLLPSPVQKINDPLIEAKGLELWVKRDDLIHPLVSGNKWRKLKYLIKKANEEGKTQLVTFGGAYSNHLLATAAAAHHFGLTATGIVRGEKVKNETLKKCLDLGMQLIFVNRDAYRDKKSLFKEYFGQDKTAFFIDEGGASAEGLAGCQELVDELNDTYDAIFCAAGTGTTAAGIYSGIIKKELNTKLHVIPVLKNGEFIGKEIAAYVALDERLVLHTNYHLGGYAKTNPELLKFIIHTYEQQQILLDPVYTAKMLWGLYDLIGKNEFIAGSKILWIHTGGLYGLLGMRKQFEAINPDFTQNFTSILEK